ncbi:MAG: lysine exporter LysO family protein [Spirochaetes bacterium]|nr:lysine exporter LysO family protein [Spirochaetota bacterium]MBU1079097.1 lysine exporter LysO family protein [Spirochaetota bacterium]
MGAFVQILVLLAFMAAGAIVFFLRLAPPPRISDLLIKIVLWALLLVMGFRLGNAGELRERLGEIGLLALGTAVASVAGTVLAIRAAYALLEAVRSRLAGRAGPAAAPGNAVASAGAEAAGGASAGTAVAGRFDWGHFKGPAVLLAVVVVGFVSGALAPEVRLDYGRVTGWVLNALLFMIGLQFAQSGISLRAAFVRADTALVPAATVVGSLAGGLAVAAVFGISAGKGLALSAGFGWYSLSGVLISDLGDPALGSAAFLANMIREALALVLIPVLAATRRPYAAIGVAGATAMDVTLPLIEQCVGPESVPVSFTSGAILSLLVPVLVPLFFSMGL